jgi:hypothetical protein
MLTHTFRALLLLTKDVAPMMKKMMVLLVVFQLAACANEPSSAYDSGWTSNTNEDAYAACGSFRIKKGF